MELYNKYYEFVCSIDRAGYKAWLRTLTENEAIELLKQIKKVGK